MKSCLSIVIGILTLTNCYAQQVDKDGRAILSPEVIREFNYMVYYQSQFETFKAVILRNIARSKGVGYIDALRILQDVSASKENRDAVIIAIRDYAERDSRVGLRGALIIWHLSGKAADAIQFYVNNGMGASRRQLEQELKNERERRIAELTEKANNIEAAFDEYTKKIMTTKSPLSIVQVDSIDRIYPGFEDRINAAYIAAEDVIRNNSQNLIKEVLKSKYEGKFYLLYTEAGDLDKVLSWDNDPISVDIQRLNQDLKLRFPVGIYLKGETYPVRFKSGAFLINEFPQTTSTYYFFTVEKDGIQGIADERLQRELVSAVRPRNIDTTVFQYPTSIITKDIFSYYNAGDFKAYRNRLRVQMARVRTASNIFSIVYQNETTTYRLMYDQEVSTYQTKSQKGFTINYYLTDQEQFHDVKVLAK